MRRLAALIVLAWASTAWSVTRYVDGALASDCTSGTYSIANRTCGSGSDGNAYKTVQAGLTATTGVGDILEIRSGTYTECAYYTPSIDGTVTNPIIIRGRSGEEPVIQANNASCPVAPRGPGTCINSIGAMTGWHAALGIFGSGVTNNLEYIRVENLTVIPPDFSTCSTLGYMCTGLLAGCVRYSQLLDIKGSTPTCVYASASTGSSASQNAESVVMIAGSRDVLIKDHQIANGGTRCGATTPYSYLAYYHTQSSDLTWVGNSVRDMGNFTCGSNYGNNHYYFFNDVANTEGMCDGWGVIQSYFGDFRRYQWNRIEHQDLITTVRGHCAGCAPNCAANNTACMRFVMAQNLFRYVPDPPSPYDNGVTWANSATRPGRTVVRNNLFTAYDQPLRFCAGGESPSCDDVPPVSCEQTTATNGYWSNTATGLVNASVTCSGLLTETGGLSLAATPLDANDCPNGTASGLSIQNVGTGVYATPSASSSSSTDLGACDTDTGLGCWTGSGAYPCSFKSQATVSTTTPTITWGVDAGDITLSNTDFVYLHDQGGLTTPSQKTQTGYTCQVDTAYTFDSQGINTPLYSSDVASSTGTSCTIAPGYLSVGNQYYFRVRLKSQTWNLSAGDSLAFARSGEIWSEPFFRFTVGTAVVDSTAKITGVAVTGASVQ